jgi:hypothetical protein
MLYNLSLFTCALYTYARQIFFILTDYMAYFKRLQFHITQSARRGLYS